MTLSGVTAMPALAQDEAVLVEVDRTMENYRLDAHIPGMVWGIVQDGRLVHVQAVGIQDVEAKRPVTPETLFRIASMTKAFTALSILRLRDEGALALDAPVETYVPELRGWTYPTGDSPKIRVRDLLTHTGGFVTDDPWGDRQTPMPEDEFTRLLRDGVPFTRPPQTAMEYSNFGSVRQRPGASGAGACREALTYAMGFSAASDCELGLTLSHGGGYPGYGSHVLLLPEYGFGIFAFANRT
jgi:CubicO group peptidase (beta-lactamase class C family)